MQAQSPIDLHLHSNHSDGSGTPTEVVQAAFDAGVRTMSLSDHDSSFGWDEAAAACQTLGMTFIPGMELSARGHKGVHLLSYLFDPNDPALSSAMRDVVERRSVRIRTMAEAIAKDYNISWERVSEVAGNGTPGRPHIAQVLVEAGYFEHISDTFSTVLSPRADYYIPTPSMDVREAIRLVRGAGGVPIIAHPLGRNAFGPMPREDLLILLDCGLAGFELDHRENFDVPEKAPWLEVMRGYCEEFDLIVTGSSDYHGDRKHNLPGEHTTSPEMLARIIEQATGSDPVYPN